jgi:hypothetical protein
MDFKEIPFKKIKLDDMIEYLESKSADEKKAFKNNAFVNGKYNHLKAVRFFCAKYFPEKIPVAETKAAPISDKIKNW